VEFVAGDEDQAERQVVQPTRARAGPELAHYAKDAADHLVR
jgi:hypothetical protein